MKPRELAGGEEERGRGSHPEVEEREKQPCALV